MTRTVRTDDPPLGDFIEVDGRRLWYLRSGDGGPAVVFVPGAGSFGLDFLLVVHRLVVHGQVVHHQVVQRQAGEQPAALLYDRAGTGWSEDVPLPRSLDAVTDELRDLLDVLQVLPPYLFVGHSLGGAYVQRYAQRFPEDVAGMLLLDPLHEDWDEYLPPALRLTARDPAAAPTAAGEVTEPNLPAPVLDQLRAMLSDSMSGFPEPVRDAVVARHASPERLMTGFREGLNALDVVADLRRGGPRPDVPVTILSAGSVDSQQLMFATQEQLREQLRGSERLYAAIAAAAPQGEHRRLADASHATLPMTHPEAVADAVAELLARIPSVSE